MVATFASSINRLGNVRVLLGLAAIFGVLSTQAGRGTLAFFTDTATSASNTFTTGTVDLQLGIAPSFGATSCTTSVTYADNTASSLFSATIQKEGTVFNQALCIKNAGTLPLQWGWVLNPNTAYNVGGILYAAAVGNALKIHAYSLPVATACTAGLTSNGVDIAGPGGAAEVVTTRTLLSGGATNVNVTATSATALAASGGADTQKLCISIVLPDGLADDFATTTLQGKAFDGSFVLTGTQS